MDTNVAVIKLFPGISERFLTHIFNAPNLKGTIIETFGSGNCTNAAWFINLLESAISKGLHVINVTQCVGGSVIMGDYETSSSLEKIGVISGKDMTTESAVSKLMFLLGKNISDKEFKTNYEDAICGEML